MTTSQILFLSAVTVGVVVIATALIVLRGRRSWLPATRARAPGRPRPWWRVFSSHETRIIISAGTLIVVGLAAWVFLAPSPNGSPTEFAMLDGESHPRDVVVDEFVSAGLSIGNRERTGHSYRLEVWARDDTEDREELATMVWPLYVEPGGSVEHQVTWWMPWAGEDQQVEFRLFTEGQDAAEPCGLLRLRLDVHEP